MSETTPIPVCATWPLCIQCGTFIAPPVKPWRVVQHGEESGPLHARCWRAYSRRTLAYPEPATPTPTRAVLCDEMLEQSVEMEPDLERTPDFVEGLRRLARGQGDPSPEWYERLATYLEELTAAIASRSSERPA